MKSLILGLVLAAASAFATTVTFDTNDAGTSFSCVGYVGSCTATGTGNGATVRVNDIVLTYTSNAASVTTASSIGVGDIDATCFTGATCAAPADFTGVTFTLDVHMIAPFANDALFHSTLSGSATLTNSLISVLLTPASVTLTSFPTSVTFTPNQPPSGYTINPPNDIKTTTLQFLVTSTTSETTPEPSSMALLASGLIGLGFIARRKK